MLLAVFAKQIMNFTALEPPGKTKIPFLAYMEFRQIQTFHSSHPTHHQQRSELSYHS